MSPVGPESTGVSSVNAGVGTTAPSQPFLLFFILFTKLIPSHEFLEFFSFFGMSELVTFLEQHQ